jgi:hypothetical protein
VALDQRGSRPRTQGSTVTSKPASRRRSGKSAP